MRTEGRAAAEQVVERLVDERVKPGRDHAVRARVATQGGEQRLPLFLQVRIVGGMLDDQPFELGELEYVDRTRQHRDGGVNRNRSRGWSRRGKRRVGNEHQRSRRAWGRRGGRADDGLWERLQIVERATLTTRTEPEQPEGDETDEAPQQEPFEQTADETGNQRLERGVRRSDEHRPDALARSEHGGVR
jgi:hypothetical protein